MKSSGMGYECFEVGYIAKHDEHVKVFHHEKYLQQVKANAEYWRKKWEHDLNLHTCVQKKDFNEWGWQ